MRAPVRCSDMVLQASATSATASVPIASSLVPNILAKRAPVFFVIPERAPIR